MEKETLRYRELAEYLNRVGGAREFLPNLIGWTDKEIWEQLPDQDSRYGGTAETLEFRINDLLGDIPYKDDDEAD